MSAKTVLKAKKKITTANKRSKLVHKADAIFGHYIRLRDSELVDKKWVGECIDGCGKRIINRYYDENLGRWRWTKSGNVGHFHSRGFRDLRYDELNCNLQSSYCNAWEDKEKMQNGYRQGIINKYGSAALEELRSKAVAKGYPTVTELEQIITDYTICLNDYLADESDV